MFPQTLVSLSYSLPMEPEADDVEEAVRPHTHAQFRRVMFVGPTGVGKSTVLNMVYHKNPDLDHRAPATTSNSSVGVSYFTEYYNWDHHEVLVDSIGFGDNRFTVDQICS